ncbi:hypothetical protein CHLRE_06g261050v5 [Chlamydomonas reinhardtii]|uniref:Uncharacterized protein n=1 Tax=Chlamydomonas reinhardtii TaxID=3055 RepID=A0A2K3DMP4_CHLRE|nr:uncharacterized protein CHLRE_06g261050v5 [Chlamydomonas reinhardtii]PNW81807.1 hypothetical protein CHLRE_06g261050v5 [Chlamydomonas reinhardtii]
MLSLRTDNKGGRAAAATATAASGRAARPLLLPVAAQLPYSRGSSSRSRLAPLRPSVAGSSSSSSCSGRGAPAAAAAAVRPGRVSRATATSVRAFRDAHRAQVLLDTATEFCGAWMAGRMEGPTERVLHGLGPLVSDDVEVEVHGLMSHCRDKVGGACPGLARLLSPELRPAGLSLRHWHCRVCAADEGGDVVFCLLELRAEDEGGRSRSCYQVLKLDMLLDDTSRRVQRVGGETVLERGQWDVAGDGTTPLLLSYASAHEGEYAGAQPDFGAPTSHTDSSSSSSSDAVEGEAAEGGGGKGKGKGEGAQRHRRHRSAVWGGQVVGSDFPVERIQPQNQAAQFMRGVDPAALKEVSRAWCAARCSNPPASSSTQPHTSTPTSATSPHRAVLDALLAPDFRLWDAYGLLPLVCRVGDRPLGPQTASGAVGVAAQPAPQQQQQQGEREGSGGGGTGFAMALMMGGGGCVAPREAVYDIIENAKAEYDVNLTPLDLAASYTHNVVFNHWTCVMTPKAVAAEGVGHQSDGEGRPLPLEQECIEVDIFDGEGRLSDVWMFRDAFEFEKHLIRARTQQLQQDMHAAKQQ